MNGMKSMTKWVIEKEIILNGRKVKAWVPNPEIPRDKALKRFIELTERIARRTKGRAS
jgi:hypothetical protein